MTLCILFSNPSSAKIQNGYSIEIDGAHASLKRLKALLAEDRSLSIFQRFAIRDKIDNLIDFIVYKEFTDRMLLQLQMISPELYYEIDTLRDGKGRSLQVYVRFVPESEMPRGVAATTNLEHAANDEDAYISEYGIHTVSVRVVAGKKCLALLAHELGHVRFQVPNLKQYLQFYTEYYLSNNYHRKSLGHNDHDPSGEAALDFTKRFRQNHITYLKINRVKFDSHLAMLHKIRKEIEDRIAI